MHVTIAYSPDTDDAFMIHALKHKQVPWGAFEFSFVKGDIQELNQEALQGTYEITAISAAAYPHIADRYLAMPVGASVGSDYGPAIVVQSNSAIYNVEDLQGCPVAVPGPMTSAYLAAQVLFGPFRPVFKHFERIAPAVQAGEATAGILIHELQMTCNGEDLRQIGDLGALWHQRFTSPLPLGFNAIRRDLGSDVITSLTRLLRQSVMFGLNNRQATLQAAIFETKPDLAIDLGNLYIDRYVNSDSLDLSPSVRDAAQALYKFGHELGICPKVPNDGFYSVI